MVEDKDLRTHCAMKDADDNHGLPDAACRIELHDVLAAAGHVGIEGSNIAAGLNVVRRLVGVGELDRIAAADGNGFRRETKILLVDNDHPRLPVGSWRRL